MRFGASYLALFGALALAGCPTTPSPCPSPPCITIDTAAGDGGPGVDTGGTMVDTGMRIDTGTTAACGTSGAAGGHCRGAVMGAGGSCVSGFRCINEFRAMTTMATFTVRTAFGIGQGYMEDPATGFFEEIPDAEAVPADDIPTPIATGSLCTQDCDVSATTDACGPCATCAQDVGTVGLLATYLFYPAGEAPFLDNTGWCRSDCTYDPAVAGATCPPATGTAMDAHTCSPASRVCVEGCISDNECRFSFEQTREGFYVTTIDRTSTSVCSPTTHRCEWTHADANSVGDVCERSSDCAEDVGLCLRGGTCGEYECAFAADTTSDMLCDGGAGVCLGNGGNMASICVQGCAAADDCNPGSTCIPFNGGATVGGFSGYCLGICDSRLDDPDGPTMPMTTADDQIWGCRTGEICDYPDSTADDLDPTGSCVPPCSSDADCTGSEGNYCDFIEGISPAVGVCRWLGQACDYLDLNDDCYGGQVCDLLAWPENPGLCVDPCDPLDATSCTAPMVCVPGTASAPRNVCRMPCVAGGPACPAGQVCQAGYCEQMTVTG